jgi:hypothetical protein
MNLFALVCFANDNDALVPEIWAQESLAILEENMVMARLVHRDFSPLVANFGDVVNTRRPSEFSTKRKTASDSVVSQDAVVTNVPVTLNQHVYVTFTIKDQEASLAMQDLVELYMQPAAMQLARSVDRILLGQVPKFWANRVGRLAEMTSSNAKDFVLDAREKLNVNKAYPNGRNLVLSPQSETAMLKTELFVAADQRGDSGIALEDARLGRILGFDTYMDQNVPYAALAGAETATGNFTAGIAIGGGTTNTAMTSAYTAVVGEYIWITGEAQPHWITAMTGTTTGVTLNEAVRNTVSVNAVSYIFKSCDVDGDYAAGYQKGITLDGIASNLLPVVGQVLSFGTTTRHTYTIIETDAVSATSVIVWLDRPLTTGIANNDLAFPGPHGSQNFAFHKDALALVTRPLALPSQALGVRAAVGSYNDLAMRVAMQYDISSQGTIVTLDMLCGTALLDANLGCVLLG